MLPAPKPSIGAKKYVWLGNVGAAAVSFSWLPYWLTGESSNTLVTFVLIGFAAFLGVLHKDARADMISRPTIYRRYAVPISLLCFLVVAAGQFTLAVKAQRASVWSMAILGTLVAAIAPIAAWLDPLLAQKRAQNQSSHPTRAAGPRG